MSTEQATRKIANRTDYSVVQPPDTDANDERLISQATQHIEKRAAKETKRRNKHAADRTTRRERHAQRMARQAELVANSQNKIDKYEARVAAGERPKGLKAKLYIAKEIPPLELSEWESEFDNGSDDTLNIDDFDDLFSVSSAPQLSDIFDKHYSNGRGESPVWGDTV